MKRLALVLTVTLAVGLVSFAPSAFAQGSVTPPLTAFSNANPWANFQSTITGP